MGSCSSDNNLSNKVGAPPLKKIIIKKDNENKRVKSINRWYIMRMQT